MQHPADAARDLGPVSVPAAVGVNGDAPLRRAQAEPDDGPTVQLFHMCECLRAFVPEEGR